MLIGVILSAAFLFVVFWWNKVQARTGNAGDRRDTGFVPRSSAHVLQIVAIGLLVLAVKWWDKKHPFPIPVIRNTHAPYKGRWAKRIGTAGQRDGKRPMLRDCMESGKATLVGLRSKTLLALSPKDARDAKGD